jgi:hypothetical protein
MHYRLLEQHHHLFTVCAEAYTDTLNAAREDRKKVAKEEKEAAAAAAAAAAEVVGGGGEGAEGGEGQEAGAKQQKAKQQPPRLSALELRAMAAADAAVAAAAAAAAADDWIDSEREGGVTAATNDELASEDVSDEVGNASTASPLLPFTVPLPPVLPPGVCRAAGAGDCWCRAVPGGVCAEGGGTTGQVLDIVCYYIVRREEAPRDRY